MCRAITWWEQHAGARPYDVAVSWGTAAEIATTVGTGVALLGVVTTSVLSLRSEKVTRDGQQLEREQAEATARRSEAAAALTEEYTRRVVEALETMATAPPGAQGPAPLPKVKWAMRNHGGDTYIVENVGDAVAKNVTLKAHETMILDAPMPADLQPGEALQFMAVVTFGTEDSTITVEWSEPGETEPRRWRYPLPPRPPRR